MRTDENHNHTNSLGPIILRLYWMLLGNAALAILGIALYSRTSFL